MKKKNNLAIRTIDDIEELRAQVFLTPAEIAVLLRIGDNSLYALLGSDKCPFRVERFGRQLIRIPSKSFWEWSDGGAAA